MQCNHRDHSLHPYDETEQLACVLAAGDIGDLEGLKRWCASLPEHTYGQIFIEVFTEYQIEHFKTPEHVGVTWICREQLRPSTRPGIGIPRCQALSEAIEAWLDEWIRADPGLWHYSLWMGARSSSIMRSYWMKLENELSELWSHQIGS